MGNKLLSIDLETLDTSVSAVILEIGIVIGDASGNTIEKFSIFPDINEQIADGRIVSGDTFCWWLKQEQAARMAQATAKRVSVQHAIEETTGFIEKHLNDVKFVLGNAPSFDCDILTDFLGVKLWEFWAERDVRTARMILAPHERAKIAVEHSAVDDAEAQMIDFAAFLSHKR